MLRPINRITSRRAALAAAGGLAGATVAAWLVVRKPMPEIAHPLGGPVVAPPLHPVADIVPTEPAAAPAAASFADADGVAHTLAEFRGRVVVLNLWATWCLPCVAELPALAALAARGAGEGIVVLPLSSDRGGATVVRRFYAEHNLATLPIWTDAKGEAARVWGARGIPTTLVIDRDGRERGRVEGSADWASDATVAAIRRLVG